MRQREPRDRVDSGSVVLGLSFGFHDAAAALVVDGEIVAAAEEERFTRVKHDASLPMGATAACLETFGIQASDVDHVVFYEKPLAAAARFLATKQRQGPRSARSFFRDGPDILGRHLLCGYQVSRMLSRLGADSPPQLQFVEHHLSHAASAFFPSPFESSAVMTVDGLGEWATASIGAGRNHRVELTEELRFPDSIGLIYSLVTTWCGFRSNDDEYKVMGLAPYGEPRYVDALSELIEPLEDGSVRVDGRRVNWFSPSRRSARRLAEFLGGPARRPEEPIGQREADLAASVQALTETFVLNMATHAHERTGERRLCLAGGVALNCVANGRLLRDGPFDEIWVQPAAGDAGGAIGAALAYWHLGLDRPRVLEPGVDGMHGAFLGPVIEAQSIDDALARFDVPSRRVTADERFDLVVDRLVDGDVVAWCDGRMEFGPRALGNHSLLADPRSETVRERLNVVTKGREEFRPFAPAVLEERAPHWFDLDQASPYMLVVAPVRAEHLLEVPREPESLRERAGVSRSSIPACTHVDASARIQTVGTSSNPSMHELLSRFERRTGCPVLVNTSFNRAGEPIVSTAEGAIASAAAGEVDLLILGDRVVEGDDLARVAPIDQTFIPSRRTPRFVERLGLAWAAAVVPLSLQLIDLGILDRFGAMCTGLFALALLVALARPSLPAALLATVATAGVWFVPLNGETRFIPLQMLFVVLSGVATGCVPLRRDSGGSRTWIGRSSIVLASPLVAADLLLLLRPGLMVPALIVTAGVVVAGAAVAFPGAWAWFERSTSGPTKAVATIVSWMPLIVERALNIAVRVISAVVTALVFAVVVLLPWAVQRLTFGDPLWAPRRSGSRWIEREVRPDLRSGELWFLDPGSRRRIATYRLRRLGSVTVAAVLVVVLVSVSGSMFGVGPMAEKSFGPTPDNRYKGSVNSRLHAMPWYGEWETAYNSLFTTGTTSQYVGTEFGDVSSRYVNWTDGVRRSWEGDPGPCMPTVDVWMMGGSAAFGTGQRDDHTIASELARVARGHGYRLRIQNRAIPGDVAWVEQRRLERAVLTGSAPPDFVIFYDGFNDVRAPLWVFMTGADIKGRLLAATDRDLVPILGHMTDEVRDGTHYFVAPAININERQVESGEDVDAVVKAAAFQYGAADELSRQYLSDRGIASMRFYQPNVNTRTPTLRDDFPGWPIGREIMGSMRKHLPQGTVDLSDVFNGDPTPYYSDDVHTIEAANIPLAKAIWGSVKPDIRKVAKPGGQSCS